jgi:voltage-gated potassium channel
LSIRQHFDKKKRYSDEKGLYLEVTPSGGRFWRAIVAFTTVGYGDIYPITPLGRLLSSIISLIGITMIAIPTGIISSAFMSMLIEKKQKEKNNSSM